MEQSLLPWHHSLSVWEFRFKAELKWLYLVCTHLWIFQIYYTRPRMYLFTYAVDDDNTNELYAEFHLGMVVLYTVYCIPNSCKYSVQCTFSRLELKFRIILALFQEENHSGFVKKELNSVPGYQEFLISTNGCTSVSIFWGVEMKNFTSSIFRFGIWCLQR